MLWVTGAPATRASLSRRCTMWLLLLSALLLCPGSGRMAVQARAMTATQGRTACLLPAFEWPNGSGYCWIKRRGSVQHQQLAGSALRSSAVRSKAEAGQLHVLVKLGQQSTAATAAAGVYLESSLGYGDYIWQIDSGIAATSASLVAVQFVHAGKTKGFNVSYAPYSQQQQGRAASAQDAAHPLQHSSQSPAGDGSQGHVTHRLRWAKRVAGGDLPRVHFESYSSSGQLLASWTVVDECGNLPCSEARVHISFWMQGSFLQQRQTQQQQQQQPQQQHSTAQLMLSCFCFCPAGQEQACSTPLGQQPDCKMAPAATPADSRRSGSGSSDHTAGTAVAGDVHRGVDRPGSELHNQQEASAAAAAAAAAGTVKRTPRRKRQAPACPAPSIEWPAGSRYCWSRRDTAGTQQQPGPNAFNSSNVAVDSKGQLALRVAKSGKGKRSKSSCAEVTLDQSLGLGTYVFEIDTNPSLIHPNLVGAVSITQDDQHEFKVVELARWAQPSIPNAQYVMQPYTSSPPHRFNISQSRVTHRLQWSGSELASQLLFSSYSAGGKVLQRWTASGGNNFVPGAERVKLSFWIMQDATTLPALSSLSFSCFSFCPLGQEASCSNAAGVPRCRGAAPRSVQPPPPAVEPVPPPPAVTPPPPPAAPPLQPPAVPRPQPPPPPCAEWQIMWPANSGYCWYTRDSGGQSQGPGNNIFAAANAAIDAGTGHLVVSVVKGPGSGAFTCGEVFLDRSLGFGDYVFVVQMDPSLMHPNLVASPFLYAANAPDGSSRELDVVEFSRWGQPGISNSQFVVQPWASNPPHVFNVTGVAHVHRLRWSGSASPQQVQFESYAADGTVLRSWTNTGGHNFAPGPERVHINHWISAMAADLPSSSSFALSCFRFCPLGQESACSAPLGTRPPC